MKQVFLLTGAPGSGKTSVLKEVLAHVDKSAGGFYTEEIRTGGFRQGFDIVTLDGNRATMAHIDIESPYRVGKYGVDLASLEKVAVPAIKQAVAQCDIVVIDEIGKMELFSSSFRESVSQAIDSGKKVLGTIMLKPHPWADNIKQQTKVEVVPVTSANRGQVLEQALLWARS